MSLAVRMSALASRIGIRRACVFGLLPGLRELMRCSACKTDNPDGLKFCNECGAGLKRACPKCGFDDIATAKFCGQCAASCAKCQTGGSHEVATAVDDIDGERRTITALFADIKGSTELMANLEPEEARAIVDPALRIMVQSVRSFAGYVVHSTGDGIFSVFGAPIAHEDHPQRGSMRRSRCRKSCANMPTG